MSRAMRSFFRLTIRNELYTNILVVPLAVGFVVLAGYLPGEKILYFAVCAAAVAMAMMGAGMVSRYFQIIPLFQRAYDSETPAAGNLSELKAAILRIPRLEAAIVVIRWIVGITLAYLLTHHVIGLTPFETVPFIVAVFVVIPISAVIFYLTSENLLVDVLSQEKIAAVRLEKGQIRLFSMVARTTIILIAIVCIPIVTLGYFFMSATAACTCMPGQT